MNDNLKAAAQHAEWVVQFLSDANLECGPVESMLVLPWIVEAVAMANKIKALIEAKG
jgi:hypothetical protein